MILKVEKSTLKGQVNIPASKSHTIRAIAIAALADGKSIIRNPLISSDTLSAVSCYRAMGAKIDTADDKKWVIDGVNGKITAPDDVIDVGNSGTTLRLAMGTAALIKEGTIEFTGDKQIQSRPVGQLLKALENLGAKAVSVKNNGKAPVRISPIMTGGTTELECITSQYLSSLLLAGPMAENDIKIDVSLLNEPDYVKITLDWLNWQNIKYHASKDLKHITIAGKQKYKAFSRTIPADFSSATFFICAAAILPGSDILIKGLDFSDSQPDKAVVDYLIEMGADIKTENDGIRVKYAKLSAATIDMNRTPDALPAIAAAAATASGTTKLINVAQARVKETDRIACMTKELKKLGAKVEELPDGVIIESDALVGGTFDGYHDHRIVMAMAIAAMACDQQSSIKTAEAINVTFPNFVELMTSLGANMKME